MRKTTKRNILFGAKIAGAIFIGCWIGFSVTTRDLSITNYKSFKREIDRLNSVTERTKLVKNPYESIFSDAKTYEDSLKIAEKYQIPIGRKPTLTEKEKIIEVYQKSKELSDKVDEGK